MTLIWLPATLLGALFQAWRTALQQRVRAQLSLNAAGLVRYLYGLPVTILLLTLYLHFTHGSIPPMGLAVLGYAAAAGIAQILATNLLLMAFGYRNYVAGTAFAKTEAVQGAFLAWIFLHETLTPLTWAGIAVGVAGVMIVSAGGQRLRLRDMAQPAALCGLGAGFGYTLTSIFVKSATHQLLTADKILAALIVVTIVQACQTIMQGGYIALREPQELPKIVRSWRTSGLVGLLAALGSLCWFTGLATAPVALVRGVGQLEVLFTLGFSHLYLKEQMKRGEAAGLILVAVGVALALAGGI